MCGRYSIVVEEGQWAEAFGSDFPDPAGWLTEPRYQVAPMTEVLVTTARGRPVQRALWGFCAPWFKSANEYGRPLINARFETVASKRSFAGAWRARQRCLVWTTGWYEWKKAEDKQPYLIQLPGRRLFAFAGLWSAWRPPDQPEAPLVGTVALLTTAPSPDLEHIHDRMPCTLAPSAMIPWLTGAGTALLGAPPAGIFEAFPVTRRLGSPRYQESDCLDRVASTIEPRSAITAARAGGLRKNEHRTRSGGA